MLKSNHSRCILFSKYHFLLFFFSPHSRIFDDHEAFTATVYVCKKPDFNEHKRSLLQGSRCGVLPFPVV